jgi:pseurotin A synthetase (hybrid polyketide synthase/nonribosomal peptide synthetase)
VAGNTFLHLFSATHRVGQSQTTLLGFTNGLSSRTLAYATWAAPHIPLAPDKLLAAAAMVLTAQHIFDLLPTGNSIVFQPSEPIASVLTRLSKDTEKTIYFITSNADVPGRRDKSWIAVPALASKATLSALLSFNMNGFFNASTRLCRLSSRITQLLPQSCKYFDQTHVFRLLSTANSRPRAEKLERILQNIGMSAISMLNNMPVNNVTNIIASDLFNGEPRAYPGLSVIDWTGVNAVPTAINSLKFSDVFSAGSEFVLIDVETNLLQLLLGWLVAGNARRVYINKYVQVDRRRKLNLR